MRARGLKPGDRCALWAPNSIRWVALDLAIMAEGIIAVPLDPRQVPAEISGCNRGLHSVARLLLRLNDGRAASSGEPLLRQRVALFDDIFATQNAVTESPVHHADHDPVTIVYTSGTSGESKGVVLNAGNISFVIGCTNARLDQLMGARQEPDRVFQYAPFCFAAARILLFTSLSRHSVLTLSTDLSKISEELKLAAPNYFVNVPMFLERVRRKVEESIVKRGGFAATLFQRAQQAYLRRHRKQINFADGLWWRRRKRRSLSRHSKEHRAQPEGANLRLGAPVRGDAALFHDARHSGAAGLRAHGNYRDLHHGRSASFRAGTRRPAPFPASR